MIRAACRDTDHEGCPGATWGGCECICHELAAAVPRDRTWTRFAACRGMDPSLFFVQDKNKDFPSEARAACARCPVRAECLEAGLGEKWGLWGGMSEKERRRERRRRSTNPRPLTHGTATTYNKWGCRCDPCRAAQRDYAAAYKARTA